MSEAANQDRTADDSDRQRRRIVDSYGYIWGRQYRRHFGAEALFPLRSLLGRMIEEAEGAGQTTEWTRHYPEVFTGQGLEFSRAWHGLPEAQRRMALVHYVAVGLVKEKSALLGIHENTYHQRRKAMQRAFIPALGM